jgi:hypothetical protein
VLWIAGGREGGRRSRRSYYKGSIMHWNRAALERNLTFMYMSRPKIVREGGCSNSMPCNKVRALRRRRSFAEFGGMERRRSRQVTRWVVTIAVALVSLPSPELPCLSPDTTSCVYLPFHSNPSCNLKNSQKAGSCLNSASFLDVGGLRISMTLARRSTPPGMERHICANRPSIWRRPLRILPASLDDMFEKESESRDSMTELQR